jgi:regulator of protease activity HflC (stomatin/prohibitin superfamily)
MNLEGISSAGNKVKKVLLSGLLIAVLVILSSVFLLRWVVVEPGYTGIKINRLVNRGITKENIVTGFVFYNPIQTAIVKYPTFMQRVAWTKDAHEGAPVNEEITFNTKDSVPVSVDAAVSYTLEQSKVPEFYTQFRADNISRFTHGFLRDTARNTLTNLGSEYTFDEINGTKKEEFLQRVGKELNKVVSTYGVNIQQFGLIGSLRPPQELSNAVNQKTQAIQKAIQLENELRQSQAEAKKKVAIAEGEAAANRALTSSLDPKLLEWERMKIQREATQKWDGKMPTVMGSGQGMLMNIPVPTGK